MKISEMKLKTFFSLVLAALFMVACSSNEPKEEAVVEEQETTEEVTEEMAEDEHDWVVHETGFGDVQLHKDEPAAEEPAQWEVVGPAAWAPAAGGLGEVGGQV